MPPRVDVHCHIAQRRRPCQLEDRFSFEPPSYAGSDAYLADPFFNGIGMRLARWFFRLSSKLSPEELDARIEAILLEHLLGASSIDRAVLLAFDQYHDNDGHAMGPKRSSADRATTLYVSNTYARALARAHPDKLLFAASIHPYRMHEGRGAHDLIEEVVEGGAVLIKWLPVVQNIDAEDPRTIRFLESAHAHRIPLLIHYGGEATLGRPHPDYENPVPLLNVLRTLRQQGRMPTVIVAHMATPMGWPWGDGTYFRAMVDALSGEFRDAPLYADISALAIFSRSRWLKRLAARKDLHQKLVYGSDFPIPVTPLWFRRTLRGQLRNVRRMPSWIDRDVAIKTSLGLDESVFERGGALLRERIESFEKTMSI